MLFPLRLRPLPSAVDPIEEEEEEEEEGAEPANCIPADVINTTANGPTASIVGYTAVETQMMAKRARSAEAPPEPPPPVA